MNDTRKVKLQRNELRILNALVNMGSEADDGTCYPFRTIREEAHTTLRITRLACRSLARKGLATYERGLINMQTDGFAGSGYRASEAGFDVLRENETGTPQDPML